MFSKAEGFVIDNHYKSFLVISQLNDLILVACYENGKLCWLDADNEHRKGLLDDIYLGHILAETHKGLCFVDIGLKRPGLLKKEAGFPLPRGGERKIVQITRESFYDKGEGAKECKKSVHLTQNCMLVHQAVRFQPLKSSPFTIRQVKNSLDKDEGERTVVLQKKRLEQNWKLCQEQSKKGLILQGPLVYERFLRDLNPEQIIVDNLSLLVKIKSYVREYRPDLESKCRIALQTECPILEHFGLDEVFSSLTQDVVPLYNGGSLIIESTVCVTTIDVNLGRGGEEKTNFIAALSIIEQLKWRSISGNILVDFIDCGKSFTQRQRLVQLLRTGLNENKEEWKILGWSRQGLLEIHKTKKRLPLAERLSAVSF